MSYVKSGYYCIVSCGAHTSYVGRKESLEAGKQYFWIPPTVVRINGEVPMEISLIIRNILQINLQICEYIK